MNDSNEATEPRFYEARDALYAPIFEIHGAPEQVDKLLTELALAQGEFEQVQKDTRGQDGNRTFMYADLASMTKASRPYLSKHRIAVMQFPLGDQGELLTIVAGHGARIHSTLKFRRADMVEGDARLAGVAGIKLYGSELTYFSRYALRSILGLPGDDDLDSQAQPQTQQSRGQRMQPDAPKQDRPAAAPKRPQDAPTPKTGNGSPKAEQAQPEPAQAAAQPISTEAPPGQPVDDPHGLDGEAVPDSGPVNPYADVEGVPMTDQTKQQVTAKIAKLLSLDGTGRDVGFDVRGHVFKLATGKALVRGDTSGFTEANGRRMVDVLYALAADCGVDPDGAVMRDEVVQVQRALVSRGR